MAVVADIDSIDLVVEPHEFSPEEREALTVSLEPTNIDDFLGVFREAWVST